MENAEDVLMHLTSFEKNPPDAVPKTLDDYLEYIARTGKTVFSWGETNHFDSYHLISEVLINTTKYAF